MRINKQKGFTLVELMVALVIGLLIILGAGHVYLSGFQNFRQIEALSDKQVALSFLADTLMRDIRRADPNPVSTGNSLVLSVAGEKVSYTLSGDSGENGQSLKLNGEPLVNGLVSGSKAFEVSENQGLYKIAIHLRSAPGSDDSPTVFIFHAMNRTKAVKLDDG